MGCEKLTTEQRADLDMTADIFLEYLTSIVAVFVILLLIHIIYDEMRVWRSPRKRAYRAGRKAQKDGKGLLDNPFHVAQEENGWWYNGWKDAYEEKGKK